MDYQMLLLKALQWLHVYYLLIRGTTGNKLQGASLTLQPPPMIHDVIDPKCYNFTHGNYQSMEFYSPNYPGQYPNDIDCVMYLQAPPGFVIELYFMDKFSVEETEGCKFDFIQLRDGPFGYSKFIAQFCGQKGFPETILTTTRFLWARFASDGLVQFDGFRAMYEYKKTEDYPASQERSKVCRIYMDNLAMDGEFDSKVFPLGDTSQRDYPIDQPVDCTWEMLAERGHRILLGDVRLHMTREEQCNRNRIEIYDGTTYEDDRTGVYCGGQVQDYFSDSNRIFVRIYGSRLSEKPIISGRYTVYKEARTDRAEPCDGDDFYCEGRCLNHALVCNGHVNCPGTKADEAGCSSSTTSSDETEKIPMLAIIIAGAAGLLLTLGIVLACVMCRNSGNNKRKRTSLHKQDSQNRNALEMAVSDSNNTAYQLAKQNNPNYYSSLPRGHATMMQHRGSFSSKVPSEGDYGDHMSDSSTYKKFLQLEQSLDEDSSRCPSPYSPGFTTIIEHHQAPQGMQQGMTPGMQQGMHQSMTQGMPQGMTPGMTPDLGWNYPSHLEHQGPPSLAENLSKLKQYTAVPRQDPSGMTMEFRYDPTTPVYPMSKFRIKSPEMTYGWKQEPSKPEGQSLTIKNQDADTAPDLTREIETT